MRVGYLFRIHYGSFALETFGAIPACFGNGALIDAIDSGQDYVILVIQRRVSITAIGVFTKVYFF